MPFSRKFCAPWTLAIAPLRRLFLALALLAPTATAAQTIAFTSPTQDELVFDSTPLFAGTADADRDIVLRIFTATEPMIVVPLRSDAGGNWSYAPTTPLDEGPAQAEMIYAVGSGDAIVDFTIVGPPPTVESVSLNGSPGPTAPSVSYTVTFSESVTGVDVSDFSILGVGSALAFVQSVSGSGAVYTVTLGGIVGDGTLFLVVNAVGTGIVDIVGNPLAGGILVSTAHTVDREAPPRPVITSPSAILLANGNVVFTGTAQVGSRVRVSLDGATYDEVTVFPSGNWTYFPPSSLSDGPHTVSAIAFDDAGNQLTPTTFSFTVDTTAPPAPVITSPGPSQVFPNPAITVAGTAEPNALVQVEIDGGAGYTLVGSVSASGSGNWSFTTIAQDGSSARARAVDAAGNISNYSSGVQIRVDSTAPAVTSVTGPGPRVYGPGTMLDFNVNFNEVVFVDTGGGMPRLALTIGSDTVYANYASGSGTTQLTFRHVIQSGALDTDGITIDALEANGGILADGAGNPANPTLNGISVTGVTVDAESPSVSLSGPTGLQTGPFTVTVTFSEPVYGFGLDDIEAINATVSSLSGSDAVYTVTVTPRGSGTVTIQVLAGAATDALTNPNTASAVLEIEAASVAAEFEEYADDILAIISDQSLRDLRARIAATERMVKAAQERLASDAPQMDRALSFQGTLKADNASISSKGSYGEEIGLANGSRRIIWGEFSVTRDAEGTTSARLDTTLAWERRLSDDALAAWFLGLEVGHADVSRDFSGPLRSMGLSLGAYGVRRLGDALYLRGFASVTAGRNDLELSNGILTLQSDYATRSLQAGATLSGALPMGGWEVRPALSLAFGRTWLGTLDLTGSAYGDTGEFRLDAGQVTLASLAFRPEVLIPLDGQPVADALTLLTLAPGLTCEKVSGVEDWSDCGLALGAGLRHQSRNGLVRYTADVDVSRVGPRKDTSLSLSLEHRF
jgi:hypothetical protein